MCAQAAFVAALSIFTVNDALAQPSPISAAAINTASVTDYIAAAAFAPTVIQVASNEAMEPERFRPTPLWHAYRSCWTALELLPVSLTALMAITSKRHCLRIR